MAGDTIVTIIGNLADDVELRFTPSGRAVANFRVGTTPRSFNKEANEWRDGATWWVSCSVWGDAAGNVAESLEKGSRVVVTGRLVSRSYDDREGVKRYTVELQADEVAPSLRFATAKVSRTGRPQLRAVAGEDPWATAPADGEPPF